MKKKWWKSKSIWAASLAFIAAIAQFVAGEDILDPKAQVMILAIVAAVLRVVTKEEISW